MFFLDWPLYEGMGLPFVAVFCFIGALIGSFFNVLSQRWGACQIKTNDEQSLMWLKLRGVTVDIAPFASRSLMGGRSSCPHCHTPIPLYRNIPIISWIIQLGRSACCGKPIAFRYLAFELLGAVLFATVAFLEGPTVYGLLLGVTLMVLALIGLIDLQDGLIPDGLLITFALLTYVLSTSGAHWADTATTVNFHVLTLLVVLTMLGGLSWLAGRGVMGTADQHLIALSAGLMGPAFFFVLALMILFLVLSAVMMRFKLVKRGLFATMIDEHQSVPAGPAIALSTMAGIMAHMAGFGI